MIGWWAPPCDWRLCIFCPYDVQKLVAAADEVTPQICLCEQMFELGKQLLSRKAKEGVGLGAMQAQLWAMPRPQHADSQGLRSGGLAAGPLLGSVPLEQLGATVVDRYLSARICMPSHLPHIVFDQAPEEAPQHMSKHTEAQSVQPIDSDGIDVHPAFAAEEWIPPAG